MDEPHSGVPKLAMKEMGSRYLFIVLYVWLESTLAAATTAFPGWS